MFRFDFFLYIGGTFKTNRRSDGFQPYLTSLIRDEYVATLISKLYVNL